MEKRNKTVRQSAEIEFSKLAVIAMESLPESALNSLKRYLDIIHTDLSSPRLSGKLSKFRNPLGENIYTLRFSVKFRAFIKINENKVTVLDIVNHNDLRKFFGKGGNHA
ncbi:MAG: hypothetical protein WCK02_02000 [Bacteroidota bacterium]